MMARSLSRSQLLSNASAKLRLLGDDSGLCRAPSVPVIHCDYWYRLPSMCT